MKDQILSEIKTKLSELGIPFQNGNDTDITIESEFLDASWSTGNKKVNYESCIFVDERDKTVYMYEKTTEMGKGLSFGSDSESSSQSGTTLFRKVKSVMYGPDGKAYEYNLDLGSIPNAVKESAKQHGWKLKTVFNKNKAMYPVGKTPQVSGKNSEPYPNPQAKFNVQNNSAAAPVKKNRKTFVGGIVIIIVLLAALVFSAVSVNIMPYIGLLLMIGGIIATFVTRKNPRKVVMLSIIFALVLQCFSFLFFSGIMQKSLAMGWVFFGLIIGGVFGFLIKLQLSENEIYYHQKIEFSFIYLSLLLVNQLIGIFYKAYIPVFIFLSALALGLYVGLHIVILIKTRKIRKIAALTLMLCLSLLIPFLCLNASAAEDEKVFQKNSQGLAYASLTNSADFQFQLPDGRKVSTADLKPVSANSPVSSVTVYSYYPNPMLIIINVRGTLAPESDNWELRYSLENTGNPGNQVKLDAQGNFSAQGTVHIYAQTWAEKIGAKNQESDYKETWDFVGRVDQSGCTLRITQPNGNFEETYFEYPIGFFTNSSQPAAQTPAAQQPTGAQPGNGTTGQTSGEKSGGSWFAPQDVQAGTANTATAASGIIAGIAALFSALGASLGTTNISDLNSFASGSEPSDPEPSDPEPPQSDPPQPKPSDPRPPVGTRREDGKIFTKNNGWQNEDFPRMQANSLNQTISSLESDLNKYAQNGDKLRAEIARDELKDSQRQLNKWNEDASMIGKIKSQDNEALHQNEVKRWDEREASMETAENTASTISFAADIALAVGTSGVSSVFTGAKSVSAVKNAITTVKALTTVKEAATAGANIYDGYARGKDMAGVVTKEIVNKGISMGVGKIFDAGKESFGFAKYGPQKSADSLKILVSSAEPSAGNVAQKLAEDSGLTGKITGSVDAADQHFKGVAQKMNDLSKGGDE
jgi:hypothetical protein